MLTIESGISGKSRRRLHRRLTGAVLLLFGLALAGVLAATLTPKPQVAQADQSQSALLRTGVDAATPVGASA